MMGTFATAVQKFRDELSKPKGFAKGEAFQCFVKNQLFANNDYDLLYETPDYTANKHRFIDSSKNPDFIFKSRESRKEFWVEAKYRSTLYTGAYEFKPYQLRRYKFISKKTPVYVALGIGQRPESPKQIFLIPMKDISSKYNTLSHHFLNKYQIPLDSMHRCRKAISAIVES